MTSVKIGKSVLVPDKIRTKQIYETIPCGASDSCGCLYCLNFKAQVPRCFPEEIIEFFDACGIDFNKDADVSELAPIDGEKHLYSCEFFFICSEWPKVDAGKLNENFEYSIVWPTPMLPEQFKGEQNAMCFSLIFAINWVLTDSP